MKKLSEEIDKNLKDSGVTVHSLSPTFYLSTTLDDSTVLSLSDITDEILNDKNSVDYSQYLAGEIQSGSQVEIPKKYFCDDRISKFIKIVETISISYVDRYFSLINIDGDPEFTCEINDMWIVNQLSGDFNPPHRHLVRSNCGLSGVFYLKIPSQINEDRKDGCFQFIWGPESRHDMSRLSLPNIESIQPIVGQIILFPQSLTHQVFPFRGDGERRCIPFNVNVWPKHEAMWKI
jgi:hypothetical protein